MEILTNLGFFVALSVIVGFIFGWFSALTLAIGLFVGWATPQPAWAERLTDKIVEKWQEFRNR